LIIVGDRRLGDHCLGDRGLVGDRFLCRSVRLEAPECCADHRLLARGSAVKLPSRPVAIAVRPMAAGIGDLAGIVRSAPQPLGRSTGHRAYSKMTRYFTAAPRNTTDTFLKQFFHERYAQQIKTLKTIAVSGADTIYVTLGQ
jgi:hypothetical protein